MIIATRQLLLASDGSEIPVPILIHAPIEGDRCWECVVEIGWPEGQKRITARAFDGVQALYLAMQRIALELYASPHHEAGNLRWDKPGSGYGFPMPKVGYEDLVGEDRIAQVPD
jgi:hypothetical protein